MRWQFWRAYRISCPAILPPSLIYYAGSIFILGGAREIAVIGDPSENETKELLQAIYGLYLPNKVVACGKNGGVFLIDNKAQVDGAATAYVCKNFTCELPVTSVKDLIDRLD